VQPRELTQGVEHLSHHGDDDRCRHRADRHLGERRYEQPDRREAEHRHGDVSRHQQGADDRRSDGDRVAREERHRSHREERGADQRSGQHHHEGRGQAEHRRSGVLDEQQPHTTGGRHQEVPQGAEACFARDRVSGHHADGEGQEEWDRDHQRRHADEQAVLRDPVQEGRALARSGRAGREPHRDGDEHGDRGEGQEHGPGPTAPEQQAQLRAQQHPACGGSRANGRRGDAACLTAQRRTPPR